MNTLLKLLALQKCHKIAQMYEKWDRPLFTLLLFFKANNLMGECTPKLPAYFQKIPWCGYFMLGVLTKALTDQR